MAKYENGREVPDDTPVEMPLRFRNMRPYDMANEIRRMVREELSEAAHDKDFETFEEADDFYVDDDAEFISPYELHQMQEEALMPSDADAEVLENGNVSHEKRSVGAGADTSGSDKSSGDSSPDGTGDGGKAEGGSEA